ncbi:hypothetical protein [Glycomyces paridis]|uniref:Uncharacterized protein n=1 Tax=Glycomyces paridis TaxID=2126555 RepID=A0A4S8PJ62_9ACTN|nr:hypothetical protein [Glycomyces paridis]THV30041.1 hypothetical protein E9998_06585 [Glycomyces paridis]
MAATKKTIAKSAEEDEEEAKKVTKLRKRLGEARQVHAIADDPYLKVVELDRFRSSITGALWFFLSVGLAYTTVGVHDFIAEGLTVADPMWWGAWAVEPALAGMLITVLRWEAAMLMRGIRIESRWVSFTKWALLGSTMAMNVLSALGTTKVELLLHIAFPALVFCLAEVMPVVMDRFALARAKVLAEIARLDATPAAKEPASAASPVRAPAAASAQSPVRVSSPVTVANLEADFDRAPAPVSPSLPPVAAATSAPTPPVTYSRPKLPAPTLAQLETRAATLAAAGRTITAADVQEVITLPASMADQTARYLAATHAA